MIMSFLKKLRKHNVQRCVTCFFPLDSWSVLEWAGAMAGEAGEVANVAKKIHRDGSTPELRERLADEIADTITYLDLLAAHQGIDLKDAIKRKFNRVSAERDYRDIL